MLTGGDKSVARFFGLNPWTAIITMAILGVGGIYYNQYLRYLLNKIMYTCAAENYELGIQPVSLIID